MIKIVANSFSVDWLIIRSTNPSLGLELNWEDVFTLLYFLDLAAKTPDNIYAIIPLANIQEKI